MRSTSGCFGSYRCCMPKGTITSSTTMPFSSAAICAFAPNMLSGPEYRRIGAFAFVGYSATRPPRVRVVDQRRDQRHQVLLQRVEAGVFRAAALVHVQALVDLDLQ